MSDDEPEFGYGAGGRPLWSVRDRDAEGIRTVLRKAGRREFSERHDGFVVEGGGDGAPFLVACTEEARGSAPELMRYRVDLVKAGYRVEPDPDDDQVLLVRDGS
ncbi:hypothetical protein [Nonomuraea jabiensis]|uniref:Uncharacterized protein n=1 Tax=Nonomuraea jabiensis TaxID=882448 RepID=A0A7W9GDX6_9ACTN|nr:hypothetical protein [Nonomuraea jabiensis]MBB5782025.1 hypothetical protein [Nonomuraea jabiensis]